MPLASSGEEPRVQAAAVGTIGNARAAEHLDFLDRRRLCFMLMVACEGGGVLLRPDRGPGEGVRIPIEQNRLLVFRNDAMSYTYKPEGRRSLLLQSWMLSEPLLPDPYKTASVRLPGQLNGEQVRCQSLALRLPADTRDLMPCNMFMAGTDAETLVQRWDMQQYFSPEPREGRSYAKHGAFCSERDLVDFKAHGAFDIPAEEAEVMDPTHGIALQVGCEALERAGVPREAARGAECGVFIGASTSDWPFICQAANPYRVQGQSRAVLGSRLSHTLGLQGPHTVSDTDSSSSLVAVGTASDVLRQSGRALAAPDAEQWRCCVPGSLSAALVVGVSLLLSPLGYVARCASRLLSRRGRCLTFDASADGSARGEGCVGMLLQVSGDEDELQMMLASLVGTCVHQDGKSSTLSSPSSASHQHVVRESLRGSGFEHSDVSVVECHGASTGLLDPFEVNALVKVLGERDVPLAATCAKTQLGDAEAAAGMAGLARSLVALLCGCCPAGPHLARLNPHLDLDGRPAVVGAEPADLGAPTGIAGVSSFGLGGTLAHCATWGRCLRGARATSQVFTDRQLARRRQVHQRLCNGTPGPQDDDRVCIMGTWDGWAKMEEMTRLATGEYIAMVTIGEGLVEQFQLFVNGDRRQCLYPAAPCADPRVDVLGPDPPRQGLNWAIDGRQEQAPVGTIYRVRLDWAFTWERGERKRVTWEATETALPEQELRQKYRHRYDIAASWTTWKARPLTPGEEEGVWTTSLHIGITGEEEFQILRDGDWAQVLHPATARAARPAVPVCGPDAHGSGRNWLIRGHQGENAVVRLEISGGDVLVDVLVGGARRTTWRSPSAPEAREGWRRQGEYVVAGTWNCWALSAMLPDPGRDGVHRFRVAIGEAGFEEFQILFERDWGQTLHPDRDGALLHQGALCGPDDTGHGLNWRIEGAHGHLYEVVLDLNEEDVHRVVSWARVDEATPLSLEA